MATTTFNGYSLVDISTGGTNVYTVSALKALVVSCIIANKSVGTNTNATVQIVRGATTSTLLYKASIPINSALDIINNKPIVLNNGDILKVTADNASTLDVILSMAEMN